MNSSTQDIDPRYVVAGKIGLDGTYARWKDLGPVGCAFAIITHNHWIGSASPSPCPTNPNDEKRIAQLILALWREWLDRTGNNWKFWVKIGGQSAKDVYSIIEYAKQFGLNLNVDTTEVNPIEFPDFPKRDGVSRSLSLYDWTKSPMSLQEDGYAVFYGGLMFWCRDGNFFLGLIDHKKGWVTPGYPTDSVALIEVLKIIAELVWLDFRILQDNKNPPYDIRHAVRTVKSIIYTIENNYT